MGRKRYTIDRKDRIEAKEVLGQIVEGPDPDTPSAGKLMQDLIRWLKYYKGVAEGKSEQELVEELRE